MKNIIKLFYLLLKGGAWNITFIYLFSFMWYYDCLVCLQVSQTDFLCIVSRISKINLTMLFVNVGFFSNMVPKNQQQKRANFLETEATTFSTHSPCSVTADDCSQTWQPQNQSLQSVQASIGIVLYPAAVSPQRLSSVTLTAIQHNVSWVV